MTRGIKRQSVDAYVIQSHAACRVCNGSKTKEEIMQVVKCNKRHVRITAPSPLPSQLFRLSLRLRNHKSAVVPIRDDLVNLRLNLVQVAF